MIIRRLVDLSLATLVYLSSCAWCLKCYQCNSSMDSSCQEEFVHSLEGMALQSTECKVNGAEYCIKTTGVWGGVAGTHRFCSSRDMGIQCQYIQYQDHDRLYMACVYSCTSDDCNAAPSTLYMPHIYSIIVLCFLISRWIHFT